MLIPLVNRTLHSDNHDTFRSDNRGTGHLSEVTKLKTLIEPVLIQLKIVLFTQIMVIILAQIMVVLDMSISD